MHLQGQWRDEQERQSREERQTIGRPHGGDVEHPFERGQDERAGHQAGEKRVQDDQHAPLELDFVRIDESVDARHG
jgi:hypothetical protein